MTDPRGVPVAGAAVMFTGASPSHRDVAAVTDVQGGFRFGGLPPGRYTVLVNATGFGPQQWPVTVEAGATARLDVVLGR